MTVLVKNNAFSTLASSIDDLTTTITLAAGTGVRFPATSSPDYFYATLINTSNQLEVVKVTARSVDTLTVLRGQDDTTARSYSSGDRIELRLTAALLADVRDSVTPSDGSVSTAKIVDEAVTTAKIDDGAVTAAKLDALVTASLLAVVPTGVVVPYAGASAPSEWLLCYGQDISRLTYAALFAALGTTYGAGDGLTTFALPDLRGRAVAGKDDMGGSAASRLVNTRTVTISTISRSSTTCTVVTTAEHGLDVGDSITIAGSGNATFNGTWTVATVVKTGAEIARATRTFTFTHTSSGTISSTAGGTLTTAISGGVDGATLGAAGGAGTHTLTVGQIANHVHTFDDERKSGSGDSSVVENYTNGTGFSTNSQGGSGPHNNVQPTLVLNYIIKT